MGKGLFKTRRQVAAMARNIAALRDLADTYGDSLLPFQLDVNDRQLVIHAADQVKTHFGNIDILIHNAG